MKSLFLLAFLLSYSCALAQEEQPDSELPALPTVEQQAEQPSTQPVAQPYTQPQTQPAAAQAPSRPIVQRPVAQKQTPHPKAPPPEDKKWSAFFNLGFTFSEATTYTLNVAGTSVASTSDKSNVSPLIGLELYRELMDYFLLGALLEYSKYNYQDGVTASDTHIGLYILPRVEAYADYFTFWGALGLGLIDMSLGTTAPPASTGTTLSSPVFGIAISPRGGVDYEFKTNWFAGGELSYVRFNGSVNGTTGGTAFSQGFVRHWFALAARIGVKF